MMVSHCRSCIEQALRHTQRCPSCNGKAKRRDVREDGTVDTIVRAFQGVEAEIGILLRRLLPSVCSSDCSGI